MIIRHVDRTGKPWTFRVECTPVQGRMFEQLLRTVRNVGSREELNLSYWERLEENTAFRDEMEHVVLSALRGWNGTSTATATPTPTPPLPTPARVSETVNVNPSTVSDNDNTNDTDDTDGDGDGTRYYWENF